MANTNSIRAASVAIVCRAILSGTFVLAIVELEEGPRMMTNIVECNPDSVKIGMAVEVTFEDVTEEVTLPKFKLV